VQTSATGWCSAGGCGRARRPLQACFPPSGGKRKSIFHPRLTTPATPPACSNTFFDTEQDLDLNNNFAAAQNFQLARNLLVTTTTGANRRFERGVARQ
jgi:hypothetical protein